MISKGLWSCKSQRLYWWRREARSAQTLPPRSLGSLVAEPGVHPRPPDAQPHVLPSGSCSWSKTLRLLRWESPVLALPWQKGHRQRHNPKESSACPFWLQQTVNRVLKPTVACHNLTTFLLSSDAVFNPGNLGGPRVSAFSITAIIQNIQIIIFSTKHSQESAVKWREKCLLR